MGHWACALITYRPILYVCVCESADLPSHSQLISRVIESANIDRVGWEAGGGGGIKDGQPSGGVRAWLWGGDRRRGVGGRGGVYRRLGGSKTYERDDAHQVGWRSSRETRGEDGWKAD